jgi:hypothetical protein
MTEKESPAINSPCDMLDWHGENVSSRKLRLLGVAFCRHIWSLFSEPDLINAVNTAELFADSLAKSEALSQAHETVRQRVREFIPTGPRFRSAQEATVIETAWAAALISEIDLHHRSVRKASDSLISACSHAQIPSADWGTSTGDSFFEEKSEIIRGEHGALVLDVFGNPFRPVALDPRWLTSTVVDLARSIYKADPRQAGGHLTNLPILADALMDAGCDDEELLAHCRSDGPHVRGCWAVDLILGKT